MELGWVFRSGDNATQEAVMSCNQHRETYFNWQRKLQAVQQNQWQDQEMIRELNEAWKAAGQAVKERISSDRVYREALKRAHRKAISDQLRHEL